MTDPIKPQDDVMRDVGSGLIRSGDQAMLLRGLVRAVAWVVLAVVRSVRYLYDGLIRFRRRNH